MIKLNNLHKYFNRKKSNEIHVINDINLTLPDKGLVVLLGPSGSGKTTLLNVLGGLDKVQGGSIQFDEQEIKHYNATTWDKIRNKHVGYIFQNYNLLTNLTVYDNISLTLNMINIYDKEEIDKRVDYILDSMGMINYRKRRAAQLSGGQQQRVAIARALAKNPKVIIADEPTGNLDSKNTQEIMNIIKKISQNKLVVLVTHEENIANFYADRIIKLQDGKVVSDIENSSNGSLDVKHETDIYLGDMRKVETINTSNLNNIDIYSDEDIKDQLDIKLIVKNKTIYLDVKSKEYKKMQLIESDSEINIYDGNYEKLDKSSFDDSDFNLQSIINEKAHDEVSRHSVITIKDSIKFAWNRIKDSSKIGKLFYVGFAGGAVLIAVAVGMLSGILNMDPSNFLQGPEEIIVFDKGSNEYDDIITLADHESVNYFQLANEVSVTISLPPVYQSYENTRRLTRSAVYSEYLDTSKLVAGRAAVGLHEIVMEKDMVDDLLTDSTYTMLGVTTYEDLMNLEMFVRVQSQYDSDFTIPVKLVGIVDDKAKVIYASKELVYMSTFNVGLYEVYEDDITLLDGSLPTTDTGLIIRDNDLLLNPIASNEIDTGYGIFNSTASFTTEEDVPNVLVRMETIEKAYFNSVYLRNYSKINFHSNDLEATIAHLKTDNVISESSYDIQLEEYRSNRLANSIPTITFTIVVLAASAVSYFFILRSSLLSRIYEVSVYRALGVSKGDIRKMFTTEVIFITTITSMIGYFATTFLLYRIQLFTEDIFEGFIYISPLSIIAGIVIIYVVNVIAGLIPVSNLLRKTPAEILSKYDF
ncbi:Macrolide export ATP-binding/permease protein MacB [Candidatus Izimaplasma bacterium HR1]|jgi:ABC-type lipoprotein export system ATPase subunit/ABC-type antimicrobial peptide transport system permease subunit|uniref:ABC transporter ATP-binding protein/permease n=1 Tax=Candidatus Izimoplasma sp. HR1 TaxID=1541959 RepID=UPI0004F81017|nr:Macrolide export ATP-binding/permease protein MacB [Candidatus Izimaplasma bacterium HR1]